MCGIAGIHRLGDTPLGANAQAADRDTVATMLRALVHRGPDDSGLEQHGRVTFGARRLSILDVAGGHQPLSDASGRIWAMQNGELYDLPRLRAELSHRHRFRTRTDTELLPYLWIEKRTAAVEGLRGMFACAIHDTADGTTMLARDPLGVKPLYWTRVGDRLLFASELKALLTDPEVPRALDLDGVGRYLAMGFVPGERTVLASIRKLRPGCRLIADAKGMRIERYWAWPDFAPDAAQSTRSLEAIADDVGARLAESTKAMLLSDRPVGLLLSGGIDSSLLVALLPEAIRRETRTFSIGFEDGGHHDERTYAREVATRFGTRHHESTVAVDLERELPRVVSMLDEPCADAASVPAYLVARAASEHVTVVLSGTGGDELFGGYRRHRLPGLLANLAWLPRPAARAAARLLGDRDQHRRTLHGERLIMAAKLLEARGRDSFLGAYLSTMEPATPSRWLEATALAAAPADVAPVMLAEMAAEMGGLPADRGAMALAADHLWYLPDDLLLKEDRTTMGASIEGRVPFLDDALVRFAASLPMRARLAGSTSKVVLRRLAERHLPARIAARGKHGFTVPTQEWLRGPLASLAGDTFASEGSGLFHRATLQRWHDEHRRHIDRSGALWAALSFELWWREIGRADTARLASGTSAPAAAKASA